MIIDSSSLGRLKNNKLFSLLLRLTFTCLYPAGQLNTYSYNATGNFVNFYISLSARSFRTAAAACLAQLHGLLSPVSQFFKIVVKKEVAFDIFPCCRICFDRYIPSLSTSPFPLSPESLQAPRQCLSQQILEH